MLWRCLTDRFQRGRSARHAKARHFEVLEDRRLLAADLIFESVTDESAFVSTWSSAPITKAVFAEEGEGNASAQGHGGGPHGTLTGIKFEDLNGNGVQDSDPNPNLDEKGIAGWEIYLDTNRNGILDAGEPSDITDTLGQYEFNNLAPGNYTIGQVLQQGWAQTYPDERKVDEVFRVLASSTAGFENPLSLLDLRVNAADGITFAESLIGSMPSAQGMAEDPITGTFYSASSTLNEVDTATGAVSVIGAITEVLIDEETNEETTAPVTLQGLTFSPQGVLYGLTVLPAKSLYTIDTETAIATKIGDIDSPASIFGISFDANGKLYGANSSIMEIDPATAELIGSPVLLGEGAFLLDITFGPDGTAYGYHRFGTPLPDSSIVSLDPLTGEVVVLGQSKSFIGSFGSELLGIWDVTVGAGETLANNFGNWQLGEIHGTSWNDLNLDGIRDPGEPGLPGTIVYVDLNDDGAIDVGEPRMTTLDDDLNTPGVDESGSYSFVDLLADTYTVREVVPQNYVTTPFPSSDPVISVLLSPGEISTDNDFGNARLPEIEGSKFADVNGNGVWDADEPGIPGAVFYLDLNDNGQLDGTLDTTSSETLSIPITDNGVATTTSLDVVGLIGTVEDLNVTLSIDHPAADDLDVFLISPDGTRVELFSDVGVGGANFTGTTLDDQAATSISLGAAPFSDSFQPLGQLSDFNGEIPRGVWTLEVTDDTNNGLTGTIVDWSLTILVDLPISEPIAVSGANGKFRFVGLDPDLGPYTVREVVSEGYVQTAPASGSYASINVTYGDIIQDNDFGNQPLAQIQGTKWLDLNLNGLQDIDEPVLSGWTIYLDLNDSGTLDEDEPTAVTDDNGEYVFTNLPTGQYVVAQVVPASWQQTFPPAAPPAAMEAGHDVKEVATLEQLLEAITTTGANRTAYASGKPFRPAKKLGNDGATAQTAESRGLIKIDEFYATERYGDVYGSGYSTVIIDTGFDLDHPFFGPDSDGDGIADRIVFQYDYAYDDNDASATNSAAHGSNVASIVGSQDGVYTGVAPGVNIIALKVFDKNGDAPFRFIEKALQWVVANAEEFNILSVNMSLGDQLNHTAETTEPVNGIADELAALSAPGGLGVIVVTSAGNNFYPDSIPGVSYPAADPNTLAVGAVWDADVGQVFFSAGDKNFSTGPDRIASFSQRHEDLVDIFAPGAPIEGAGLDGGVSTFYGTSQAAPHIAAVAVLAQQIAIEQLGRRLTMEEFAGLLKSSGVTIYDGDENQNGIVDGDEEDDNVVNTELYYQRVDALALADAILDMATGKTLGDGTWTVMVAPGDLHTEVDFAGFTTFDFGDAPDSYPTLLADDGAIHAIAGGGPILGSVIDSEADANVSTSADGDDVTAADDEDGVLFTTLIGQGELASVRVVASGAGLVNAWIDFNHDADWDDEGEQILTDSAVVAGVNELQFDVPNGATVGATFARFRIATESGLAPTGLALDGEVEDYLALITQESGLLGDVDSSGVLDAADIDLLYANFGSSDPVFDLTNDGAVNQLDVDLLVRTLIGTQYGDANLDKVVDIEDFGFVFGNLGRTGVGWADGSFNGDDIVDIEDFGFVFGNFGFDAAMGPVFAMEAFVASVSVRSDETILAEEAAEDEDDSGQQGDQQGLTPPKEGPVRGVSTASVRRVAR